EDGDAIIKHLQSPDLFNLGAKHCPKMVGEYRKIIEEGYIATFTFSTDRRTTISGEIKTVTGPPSTDVGTNPPSIWPESAWDFTTAFTSSWTPPAILEATTTAPSPSEPTSPSGSEKEEEAAKKTDASENAAGIVKVGTGISAVVF